MSHPIFLRKPQPKIPTPMMATILAMMAGPKKKKATLEPRFVHILILSARVTIESFCLP